MRLEDAVCRRLVAAARHGHLGTVRAAAAPRLVPVTFALVEGPAGDEIVSVVDDKPKSTPALRRLTDVAARPAAAVLVDRYHEDWDLLWWVRAEGEAVVERSGGTRERAVDALAARYARYRDRRPEGAVLRLRVHRWSGWAATEAAVTGPAPGER